MILYIAKIRYIVHSFNIGAAYLSTDVTNFHVNPAADFIHNIQLLKILFCPLKFFVGSENSVVGMFSFVSSSSILVTTDNQFWVRQEQNPISYFPARSLFRHFKHVYGLIFKHESVFFIQVFLQDFEMKSSSLTKNKSVSL